ncbi:MAG: DNA polymerase III subunit delta [Xanthomonadales bacterium]
MAVKADRLPAQLAHSLEPVYLVAGAEALLVQECRDQIIEAARKQGFAERDVYQVEGKFDWAGIAADSAAPSLFSARKIIDIRLPAGKPGKEGAKVLGEMAISPDPDILLLVSCGQWSAASRKTKWAATLAKHGILVEIWPVKPHELPNWIRNRMLKVGLNPEPDAVVLLSDLVEGNLLAAQQEIDKLLLLDQGSVVTAQLIHRSVANSARFDSFRLVECSLLGRLDECLRVAAGLHRMNTPIQIVVGALLRELSLASTVRAAIRSGENESSVFRKFNVWSTRQGPMKAAIARLSEYSLDDSFRSLAQIDRQSKGRASGDPWQTLDRLLWHLCEPGAVDLQLTAQ